MINMGTTKDIFIAIKKGGAAQRQLLL